MFCCVGDSTAEKEASELWHGIVRNKLREIDAEIENMNKRYSWPDNHWNGRVNISHQHGVRCGSMIWVGGQVDMNARGKVQNSGDLASQTVNSMAYFGRVLDDLDCDFHDLVSLLCFYVNDGSVDETQFLRSVAACLPEDCRTTVTAIPVPYLGYDGLMVEIEGCAMRRQNGDRTKRSYTRFDGYSSIPEPFVEGLRSDKMIFVSGQYPVDESKVVSCKGDIVGQTDLVAKRMCEVLNEFGAGFDDVVKINRWYVGGSGIDDFEAASLGFAKNFSEPGPAATGIPIPRHADEDLLIKIAAIAMLGEDGSRLPRVHSWPDGLWDWHVHLPYKHGLKCDGMIFLGGQVSLDKQGRAVHPGDLSAQTHQTMQHIGTILDDFGASYDDVCKVMAVYQGSCGPDELRKNLPIRSSYFGERGPASTGVPLPALAYDSMVIEIDIYAMVDTA